MKTVINTLGPWPFTTRNLQNLAFLGLLATLWLSLPGLLNRLSPTVGLVDPGIWQLIFLAFIVFLGAITLAWWLLYRYWHSLQLPQLTQLLIQFKTLTSWQQIAFYWASFALCCLVLVGCLLAVL